MSRSRTSICFPSASTRRRTGRQWGVTLQLAAANRLTLYDASYLELAICRNLPLASFDEELRTAAKASGVRLMGV
jgi:predicted nucleic acid-binding protein